LKDMAQFDSWYLAGKATNPEVIGRALRWLKENGFVIIPQSVEDEAERKAEIVKHQA